jgi:putative hydrolase of the HAD superfamily
LFIGDRDRPRDTSFSAAVFDFFGTLTPSTPASIWEEHAVRLSSWRAPVTAQFGMLASAAAGRAGFFL